MLINPQLRYELFDHIRTSARERGTYIDHIGGMPDHVHCLLFLDRTKSISTIMREIKAEASHWYNKAGKGKIEWQDDYFAVSISPERIDAVRRYIRNQEEHHRNRTFNEEYDDFLKAAGIDKTWIKK